MPNVIELLKHDHREVEQLFAKFESSHDAAIVGKDLLGARGRYGCRGETCLPRTARRRQWRRKTRRRGRARTRRGEADHRPDQANKDAQHLNDLVAELNKAIEHHVQEEERTVFPKMQADVGETELNSLGTQIQEFKQKA